MSGLIGLLQTKDKVPEAETVTIIGPQGSKDHVNHLLQSCHFNVSYDIDVVEVPQDKTFKWENDETTVEARYLDHGVPCVGFRVCEKAKRRVNMDDLREKGIPEGPHIGELQRGNVVEYDGEQLDPDKYTYVPDSDVVSYVVDTQPCEGARRLADQADVLIAESTFDSDHKGRAEEYYHMTAEDAGMLANDAGVSRLFLTHFSQRYRDVHSLVEEASARFEDVFAAKDFLEVNIAASEGESTD
jgi:ribonuclease Z